MRIVQRGFNDLVVLYLVGSHLDAVLRSCLPRATIVAFDDQGVAPAAVAAALGLDHVRSLVLCGYSAGCQAVRSALRSKALSAHDRFGVVCIDGTHASLPPEQWQIDVWHDLAVKARDGRMLFVATCTNNVYVQRLERPYMATLLVLRAAIEPALFPASPPHEIHQRDLHLYAYGSKECDRAAHAAQQTSVLPEVLRKHVESWLAREHETLPIGATCAERALEVARSFVGWRETGPNRGSLVRESFAGCMRDGKPLGIVDGAPWCAAFVGLCDHRAGANYAWRASVRELVEDARADGLWFNVGTHEPQPGDLAVFKRNGKDPRLGDEGHVERVERADGTRVTTIGGNVSDAVTRTTWKLGDEEPGHELVGWISRTMLTEDEANLARGTTMLSLDMLARGIGDA